MLVIKHYHQQRHGTQVRLVQDLVVTQLYHLVVKFAMFNS